MSCSECAQRSVYLFPRTQVGMSTASMRSWLLPNTLNFPPQAGTVILRMWDSAPLALSTPKCGDFSPHHEKRIARGERCDTLAWAIDSREATRGSLVCTEETTRKKEQRCTKTTHGRYGYLYGVRFNYGGMGHALQTRVVAIIQAPFSRSS